MEQNEIIEGNKLIAEFHKSTDWRFDFNSFAELKYHTSWDWLMPVYDKIATEWSGLSTKKQGQVKDLKRVLQNRLVLGDINGVWEFCIEFIKWYNTQTSTP